MRVKAQFLLIFYSHGVLGSSQISLLFYSPGVPWEQVTFKVPVCTSVNVNVLKCFQVSHPAKTELFCVGPLHLTTLQVAWGYLASVGTVQDSPAEEDI